MKLIQFRHTRHDRKSSAAMVAAANGLQPGQGLHVFGAEMPSIRELLGHGQFSVIRYDGGALVTRRNAQDDVPTAEYNGSGEALQLRACRHIAQHHRMPRGLTDWHLSCLEASDLVIRSGKLLSLTNTGRLFVQCGGDWKKVTDAESGM